MQTPKRIVVIAGEESGDMHAAAFIRELKQRHTNLEISGIGGQHMEDAGVTLVSDLARYGTTGLSEVIRNLPIIRRAFHRMKAHLQAQKPDLLVMVDFPGFNLRLLKFAKQTLGIRILYYISPQIWAWKPNRIQLIRAYVDKMAVILPFEKALYERAGVPVAFVGHPLMDKILANQDTAALKAMLGLPHDKRLLAILPGSRVNEIERLMPVLRDSAIKLTQAYPDVHVVIPVARTINPELIQSHLKNSTLPYTLIKEQAVETVYCSDYVVVASGTASLECALLTKPMCIVYKVSWLTYFAACKLIRIKFIGLCNLLQQQMIVPELLQYDCNVVELYKTVTDLMTNTDTSSRMVSRLQQLKQSLSAQSADFTISQLIEHEMNLIHQT